MNEKKLLIIINETLKADLTIDIPANTRLILRNCKSLGDVHLHTESISLGMEIIGNDFGKHNLWINGKHALEYFKVVYEATI